jgi:transposase
MLPSSVRIFVCLAPQDLRRSFDGLSGLVTGHLGQDPRSGALYVFLNKRRNRAKVMWFERHGYCMLYKRLHGALFRLPATPTDDATAVRIDGAALASLLEGVARPDREFSRNNLDVKAAA